MKNEETVEILDRVLEFSKSKGLFDCGIVVVGLSGGPDSVALLHILKGLKNCFDIDCDIHAIHCNHHLRPGVCDEEAELVKELCNENHVELKVLDFDCKAFALSNHISEETAGRVLRYEAFEQYAGYLEEKTGRSVRIAIAHHKDDIAETMMMNLFRGSGLDGLVNPKAIAGRIIRPLLCLKKSELTDYLDTLGISYAIDQTNLTALGTRNTWRNRFLPEIGGFYREDPTVPLTRTYRLLGDDLDFICSVAAESYTACRRSLSGYPVLSVSGMKDLHPALKSRAIRLLWQETFGDLIDFEESHLRDCYSLLDGSVTGEAVLDMPFGRKAYRHGDVFGFANESGMDILSARIAIDMGFLTSSGPVKLGLSIEGISKDADISTEIPNSSYILKTRIIEIGDNLEYNNCSWFCPLGAFLDGEITLGNLAGIGSSFRMKKAGARGGKELNRLMTDLKIPKSARRQILFVESKGNVLWLPGFGHGIGFTNAISRSRDIEDSQSRGAAPEALIRFTIERQ